jgi:hypothetical protein
MIKFRSDGLVLVPLAPVDDVALVVAVGGGTARVVVACGIELVEIFPKESKASTV